MNDCEDHKHVHIQQQEIEADGLILKKGDGTKSIDDFVVHVYLVSQGTMCSCNWWPFGGGWETD